MATIGAPFFEYVRYPDRDGWQFWAILALFVAPAIGFLGLIAGSTDHQYTLVFNTQTLMWWAMFLFFGFLLVVVAVLFALVAYITIEGDVSTIARKPPNTHLLSWLSVYSPNDEAMIALRYASVGRPLFGSFVKRDAKPINGGWLSKSLVGLAATSVVVGVGGLLVWVRLTAFPVLLNPDERISALLDTGLALMLAVLLVPIWQTASFVIKFLLYGLLGWIRAGTVGGIGAVAEWADKIVIARLADWVYGNDVSPRIVGVANVPWPGFGQVHRLEGDIHAELERHIVSSYPSTMADIRAILSASDVNADRSFNRVWTAITWNEIAHTAYFKNTMVSSYIIDTLCDFFLGRTN